MEDSLQSCFHDFGFLIFFKRQKKIPSCAKIIRELEGYDKNLVMFSMVFNNVWYYISYFSVL